MSKHKLYSSNQNSPYFNASMEKSIVAAKSKPTSTSSLKTRISKKLDNKEPPRGEKEQNQNADLNTSSSDSMDEPDFFSKVALKIPYSLKEDEIILKYVLKGENINRVGSILLWKELEVKKENPRRTYQSLKNRFLRNIKPVLFTRFSHLITSKETIDRILLKFPELRKQSGKKETLPGLTLPKRITEQTNSRTRTPPKDREENRVSSTSLNEAPTVIGGDEVVELGTPVKKKKVSSNEKFYRIVKVQKNNSLTVTFNHGEPETKSSKSSGIYETYLNLKNKNVLIPCSTCGRCGDPGRNDMESDTESDLIIPNSVGSTNKCASQKSNKNVSRKNLKSPLSGSSHRAKRRRKHSQLAKHESSDMNPCSQSLLNDISLVEEISGTCSYEEKDDRNKMCEESRSKTPDREADLASTEFSKGLSEKDLESLYQETIAHGQRLMDSDEEEILVHNCLKKNCGEFGFQTDLSISKMNVESFFVQSNSPTLKNFTESAGEVRNESTKSPISPKTPLARNMAKMLQKK